MGPWWGGGAGRRRSGPPRRPRAVRRHGLRLDLATSSVQVDASRSAPGEAPIGSYRFDFGDGTVVTQASAVASHRYAQPGDYNVVTTVVGTDGQYDDRWDFVTVMPLVRTVDIVDAGVGQVGLVSHGSGKYLTVSSQWIAIDSRYTHANISELFTLVRNADGSISIRSAATDHYIGVLEAQSPTLYPAYPSITRLAKFHEARAGDQARTWERFTLIRNTDGSVSLAAAINDRYVAAEAAGAQPLLAGRTAINTWEKFTLV